jgi:hypothetical protein
MNTEQTQKNRALYIPIDSIRQTKVTRFRNGEVRISNYSPRKGVQRKKINTYNDEQNEENNQRMREYRRKKMIHDTLRMIIPDRMITLTFRENVTDTEEANALFKKFIKHFVRVGVMVRYFAVTERQKRGAWHLHIAVSGYHPIKEMSLYWKKIIKKQGFEGNANITRKPRQSGQRQLTTYLSKYLMKESSRYYKCRAKLVTPDEEVVLGYNQTELLSEYLEQMRFEYVKLLEHGVIICYTDTQTANDLLLELSKYQL